MAAYVALADRAFVDENYEEAVDMYTKALQPGQNLAKWTPSQVHEARAYAHFKLARYMEAVQDASKAIELDAGNSKAYQRKGMACYKLEEYETALGAFCAGLAVQPNNPQLDIWIAKCKKALADEGVAIPDTPAAAYNPNVAPANKASAAASSTPQSRVAEAKAQAAAAATAKQGALAALPPATPAPAQSPPSSSPASPSSPAVQATPFSRQALAPAALPEPTGKYRHQWYQIGAKVVVDVYAKNLPKDAVTVQLGGADNDSLAITIPEQQQQQQQQQGGGGGSGSAAAGAAGTSAAAAVTGAGTAAESAADAGGDYVLQLDLFGAVSPEVPPKVEVLRTKVEITLIKAQPNVHWPALEKGGKGPGAAGVAAAAPAAAAQAPAAAVSGAGQQQPSQQQQQQQQQGPPRVYPSSKGAKDWSKVEAEVKEMEEKGELEDGDPLNGFFKKIFAQGDEDTRRAMMKSFVESNGTVLSTNWQEVGAKRIDCTPPEGMELRKWNE